MGPFGDHALMKALKPFLTTTVWVSLGKAGGILVPFLIALLYGASPATDAFFFSYSLIIALMTIFSHVFELSLVPFLVERKENADQAAAFAVSILKRGLPVCFLIGMVIALALPFLLGLRAAIPAETSALIPRFFWEMLPGLFIASLISAYHGFFYAYKIFWFPSVSTLFRTSTMILFFLFGREALGIHALTWGFVAGEGVRWLAAQAVFMRRFSLRFKFNAPDFQPTSAFFKQAFYQVFAGVAINMMPIADQWAAAPLGPGKLSLFNYADRLIQIPYLLFFYGFTQVFFSLWSESHSQEKTLLFFEKIQKDMRRVFVGVCFFVLMVILLSDPMIRLVFQRSHLTQDQLQQILYLFLWLTLGFVPGVFRILYGRILIITQKSKIYLCQAWVELLAKIALNFLLARRFGIAGIPMATLIIYSLSVLWFHFFVRHQTLVQGHPKGKGIN